MNHRINKIKSFEILDSRGNPTVKTVVWLENGIRGSASIPSGASTGLKEVFELRDGNKSRFGGKGVLKAVENVNKVIAPEILGMNPDDQAKLDHVLLELDGSSNKKNLGANAILSISMSVADAAARNAHLPLFSYLGKARNYILPIPMINILNGGLHADNSVDIQEFMIMPKGAPNFREALRYGSETFQALKTILLKKGYSTGIGDEGGFAPNLKSNEEAFELIIESIEQAGYKPGEDIFLAIDVAASSLFTKGNYNFNKSDKSSKTTKEMISFYQNLIKRYPICSIEDPMDENDWKGFSTITKTLGENIQIVGDDLFVTNTIYVERGIIESAANAVLIKLNQIGTVTETVATIDLCRKAGWNFIISHRSGETEDTFIADFAVAMGGGQIKTGSVCRSERTSKYNRLLEIELDLDEVAQFG